MPHDPAHTSSKEREESTDSFRGDRIQRRNLLKHAGVAVGVSGLGQQVGGSPPHETVNFSNIGLAYRIEDDVEIKRLVDCSPSSWMQRRDELYLFTNRLRDVEQSRILGREHIVATDEIHSPPIQKLSFPKKPYLPTDLGTDLSPSRGVNVEGEHSPPEARVVTVDRGLKVITPKKVRLMPPESKTTIELESQDVIVKKKKIIPLGRETTGVREGQEAMRVEYNPVDVSVTPILAIQNRGKLPYQLVSDQSVVN